MTRSAKPVRWTNEEREAKRRLQSAFNFIEWLEKHLGCTPVDIAKKAKAPVAEVIRMACGLDTEDALKDPAKRLDVTAIMKATIQEFRHCGYPSWVRTPMEKRCLNDLLLTLGPSTAVIAACSECAGKDTRIASLERQRYPNCARSSTASPPF